MSKPLKTGSLLGAVALGGALLVSGCSKPDERFVQRSEQRLNRIDRLVDRFAAREADGGRRLDVMGERIESNIGRHEQLLARDMKNLDRWFEREVERWPRRKERIGQLVSRSMRGDPANINRTIPYLFYSDRRSQGPVQRWSGPPLATVRRVAGSLATRRANGRFPVAMRIVSPYSPATMSATAENAPDLWTINRLLDWTRGHFERCGLDEPRLAVEILLAHSLQSPRIQLYTRFDQVPEPAVLDRFRDLVRRAAQHEPIAYLVGEKEFFSLAFKVSPAVLIPRPETELVVQTVIDDFKSHQGPVLDLLDFGTGSSAIAVALARFLPAARILATDVSREALAVARENVARHDVVERVTLVEADRLALPAEAIPGGGFHAIVSNPPYISPAELANLDPTVRDFEPRAALTDEGDGLSFFRTLASDGPGLLQERGRVYVEIGEDQPAEVAAIFSAAGFDLRATHLDLAGHARVMAFQRGSTG